jgi:hypothetical protein
MLSEKTKEYRKTNNLCPRCGQPKVDGKSMCQRHLDKFANKSLRKRHNRINKGLCPSCGNLNNKNQYFCDLCKPIYQKIYKEKYNKRKEDRLCIYCGQENNNNGILCSKCIEITYDKSKIKRKNQKEIIINYYGGKCFCCGENNIKFLTIDHINNDGYKHHKEIKIGPGSNFYRWIIKNNFPENIFQVACYNCNCGRAKNNGICPHQQKLIEEVCTIDDRKIDETKVYGVN